MPLLWFHLAAAPRDLDWRFMETWRDEGSTESSLMVVERKETGCVAKGTTQPARTSGAEPEVDRVGGREVDGCRPMVNPSRPRFADPTSAEPARMPRSPVLIPLVIPLLIPFTIAVAVKMLCICTMQAISIQEPSLLDSDLGLRGYKEYHPDTDTDIPIDSFNEPIFGFTSTLIISGMRDVQQRQRNLPFTTRQTIQECSRDTRALRGTEGGSGGAGQSPSV
ncbi:hypothetical protein DFH06DRAFT_1122033 [Mycena polygramma]|nr:hypothetical protein DFH06DRAFT_1122033 [Mycena polygramma]